MAVTVTFYDAAPLRLTGMIDPDALKLALVDDSYVFDPAHHEFPQVAGAEVHGNGWPEGGVPIFASVQMLGSNGARLVAAPVEIEAEGGAIGPARGAVLHDDSHIGKPLVLFVDFGEDKTADEGTEFRVVWHADGIVTWTVAS